MLRERIERAYEPRSRDCLDGVETIDQERFKVLAYLKDPLARFYWPDVRLRVCSLTLWS